MKTPLYRDVADVAEVWTVEDGAKLVEDGCSGKMGTISGSASKSQIRLSSSSWFLHQGPKVGTYAPKVYTYPTLLLPLFAKMPKRE